MNDLDLSSLPEWARLEIKGAKAVTQAVAYAQKALEIEKAVNKALQTTLQDEVRYYEDRIADLSKQLSAALNAAK